MGNTNLITIFLTGLITGGLTCMAVQGGLLAATIAQREQEKLQKITKSTGNALPILMFLGTKLIAYTILGLLLGWFGSLFQLSLTTRVVLQFAVALFMIGTALNILHVHPIFRYFAIQPPKFLTRIVRKQSKNSDLFAPALLGAFTVFIPCGTTQAMMALAIASGNPLTGAAILFAFVFGTSPVFFLLGYLATRLGGALQEKFMKVAAFAIILLAIFNFNNTLALTGSNMTLDNVGRNLFCFISYCNDVQSSTASSPGMQASVQTTTITIGDSGYSPGSLTIKAGSQVKIHLDNNGGAGCIQTFTIPKLGIEKSVPLGTKGDIAFTAPNQPGQLSFMCSMGMYRGVINVI